LGLSKILNGGPSEISRLLWFNLFSQLAIV